jgi:hypothetical protein
MAQLTVAGVTHPPVELFRTQHSLSEDEWAFYTRELSEGWEAWAETHTRPAWLLGGHRPIHTTHVLGRARIMLTDKENRELQEQGVAIGFKITA